jgi:hypothetical protein
MIGKASAGPAGALHRLPEKRLGRTLMACDFITERVNDPNKRNISQRMRARLTATEHRRRRGRPKGSKNTVIR